MTPEIIQKFAKLYNCDEAEVQVDGILNPDLYASASPKVLWILKETWVHDSCKLMAAEGAYDTVGTSPTYQPIAYVMHSIFNGFIPFKEMTKTGPLCDNPQIFDSLRHIAFINVKKRVGKTQSQGADIFQHYSLAKDLIIEQINTINPDIIIGCQPHFQDIINTIAGTSNINHIHSLDWTVTESEKLLIHSYHPQQTSVSRESYVDEIVQTVKQFVEKNN